MKQKDSPPGAHRERWEPLGNGVKVLVTPEHGFTTDTILLAEFSAPGKNDRCADLGTGCGAIPLLWASRFHPAEITGVELQEEAWRQAKLSAEENQLPIRMLRGDIREYRTIFAGQKLDLIACNPPYKAPGSGLKSPREERRIARHEEEMSLCDLGEAAGFCLRFGGSLCICQRPERLTEAMLLFREYGLEPKVLRLVQARAGKAPSLFLLRCRRGGKPGLRVLPTLLLEENGRPSPELLKIYGAYTNHPGEDHPGAEPAENAVIKKFPAGEKAPV